MTVDRLNAALAAALAEVHEPHKSGSANTGTYGYTYLTLPDLSAVVRAAFAGHGLAFTQHVSVVDGGVEVTTRLVHTSGCTWRTEPFWMPAAARNPQAIGSAVTYARRYQLAALVGLSGTDDDDGHKAAGRGEPHDTPAPESSVPRAAQSSRPAGTEPALTDAQRRRLWATARAHGYGNKPDLAAFTCGLLEVEYSEDKLGELTKAEASRVIDALQQVKVADRSTPTGPPADLWQTDKPEQQ